MIDANPDTEIPRYKAVLRALDEATSPDALRVSDGSGLEVFLDFCDDMEPPLTSDEVYDAMYGLADRYDRTDPIIEGKDEQRFNQLGVYGPWKIVGGIMLREMQRGRIGSEVFTAFLNKPVSEMLPREALDAAEGNSSVASVSRRYPWLYEYVSLPMVPEERVGSVLQQDHYRELERPTKVIDRLREYDVGSSAISIFIAKERLDGHAQRGSFHEGVTPSERRIILLRSMFGRDVKLLALGAELLGQKDLRLDEQNILTLSGGTKIYVVPGQEQKGLALLNVNEWHGRTQIKDRVYRVSTEAGQYILKEHKTNRHIDVWDPSVLSPVDSRGEVAIATEFMQRGRVDSGNVSATWERPIGFAKDQGGFDFAIFEHESNIVMEADIDTTLREAIIQNPDAYQTEFDAVHASMEGEGEVSWSDFARAKAHVMKEHARLLLRKTMVEAGYVNADGENGGVLIPDHAYRIDASGPELRLEIIGMDFEYFVRLPDDSLRKCQKHFDTLIDNRLGTYKRRGMIGAHNPMAIAVKGIVQYAQTSGMPILPEKFD